MHCLSYEFYYNVVKYNNTLFLHDDNISEDEFSATVSEIKEIMTDLRNCVNNAAIRHFMCVNLPSRNTRIKCYFDKSNMELAIKHLVYRLYNELEYKFSFDITPILRYNTSNIEMTREYPIVNICPSKHEEFIFSIYPLCTDRDSSVNIADVIISTLKDKHILKKSHSLEDSKLIMEDDSEVIKLEYSLKGERYELGILDNDNLRESILECINKMFDDVSKSPVFNSMLNKAINKM